MKPDRWQQVVRLYAAALERTARDRGPYLRETCGDDEKLLREIEALLSDPASARKFLAAGGAFASAAPDDVAVTHSDSAPPILRYCTFCMMRSSMLSSMFVVFG